MASERLAEVAAIAALATVVIVVIAVPVIRAPSERIFGAEIVGRHHDPFTVMEQFDRPRSLGLYSQPVTDISGALIARATGPVAAYNWLVLLSFPLSAAAAYLLARHLTLSRTGAAVAAMAFAFSPFHVAQAAYHPHIAQTQWVPLYLLALWRCLDRPTPSAIGLLVAAAMVVTLSNFYGGLIMAVVTPAALAAYWLLVSRAQPRPVRRLIRTVGTLACIAAAGLAYVAYVAPTVTANSTALAFPRADLFRYSAKWWSYLLPPVEHPILGASVHRLWTSVGVREGLLEQQLALGWGIVALGLVAIVAWLSRGWQQASLSRVPVLVIVAVVALVCSLSPERTIGEVTIVRPSALLYEIVPMFRAYARFGVVVQLMAVLLAGFGVDHLRRTGTAAARIAAWALVALAAGEYVVAPSSLSRDVLPTTAHRWIVQQPGQARALDCAPVDRASASSQWLTGHRVTSGRADSDCTEPNLPEWLAAAGYTHLIIRRGTADGAWLLARTPIDGLRVVADLPDGQVLAVTAPQPLLHVAAMSGFFPREYNAEWSWRWMGPQAAWTLVNPGNLPIAIGLDIEMSAFHVPRHMTFSLDGRVAQTAVVEPTRGVHRVGPLTLEPGAHELMFHAVDAPTRSDDVLGNGDPRRVSVAVGAWRWSTWGEHP